MELKVKLKLGFIDGSPPKHDVTDIAFLNAQSTIDLWKNRRIDMGKVMGLNALGMERGFLSQKGIGVGKGVKEKQASNTTTSSNVATNTQGGKELVDATVNTGPSKKAMNFCTLFTPRGNEIDMVVLEESLRAISARFANMVYGFFLGNRVAYPAIANYVRNTWGKYEPVKLMLNSFTGIFSFQSSFMDGLDAMLENGNVPVWVKLHGVPMTSFSKDGLSAIATKLGTPLMLDSYTSDMHIQSWGRLSYARAMIEVQADVELKDTIVVESDKRKSQGLCEAGIDPLIEEFGPEHGGRTRGLGNVGFRKGIEGYVQKKKRKREVDESLLTHKAEVIQLLKKAELNQKPHMQEDC
ncbi:beta-caryophyllene synthase [Tanacetum coccineum]